MLLVELSEGVCSSKKLVELIPIPRQIGCRCYYVINTDIIFILGIEGCHYSIINTDIIFSQRLVELILNTLELGMLLLLWHY